MSQGGVFLETHLIFPNHMPSSHPFLVLVLLGVASVALSETVLQQLTHCRLDENVVAFNWALRKHPSPDDEWGGPQYTGRPDPLHVVVKSTYHMRLGIPTSPHRSYAGSCH